MFFNLGEEIREARSGPWASAWRVESFLASGRHFRHYQVRSLAPGLEDQRAVLKVIKYDPRRCGDEYYIQSLRARLRRERETLAHFSPRLPEPVDFFEVENLQDRFEGFGAEQIRLEEPILVRTLVHGSSLSRLMEETGAPPASAELLLNALACVCGFLHELHADGRGWLFWELTPDHIIVDPQQNLEPMFVGACNFRMMQDGVAVEPDREVARSAPLPEAGYAAPEVLAQGKARSTSDLYSVGALLFHLFSGVDPRGLAEEIADERGWTTRASLEDALLDEEEARAFCGELRRRMERLCRRNLKGLGSHRGRIRRLMLRALHPNPLERPQSALEIRNEILSALARTMPMSWPRRTEKTV